MEDDASSWNIGDDIVIASTDFDFEQAERFKIVAVNGKEITVSGDLSKNFFQSFPCHGSQNFCSLFGNYNFNCKTKKIAVHFILTATPNSPDYFGNCNINCKKIAVYFIFTLTPNPPDYMHYGEVYEGLDMRAEVGMLTRNIKVQKIL